MRSIAASLLILAASILFVGATLAPSRPAAFALGVVGCVVFVIGLFEWFVTSAAEDAKQDD